MKIRTLLICLYGFQFLPACGQQTPEKQLESLYKHTVPLVQVEELSKWKDSENQLILLDTRSAREYEVSHIPGAEFIDYDSFQASMVQHLSKSSKVVVYCSVGYRSERVGETLKQVGFKNVYNLYGGIFQWKNLGKTVVDKNNHRTDSVHAYNRYWGKWLKQGIKVYD